MIRRLNYTGRIKIYRADLQLGTVDSKALSFSANLRLNDYELPAEAQVFVEAYRQTTWMRFSYGTVAAMQPPADRLLSEFDSPDGIRFRVKVTQAHDEHILLAVADRIPLAMPSENADSESLLPVTPADLGDELWQLAIDGEQPELLVNSMATPDWHEMSLSPVFVALVYPTVLRLVLTSVLEEGHRDTDDAEDWRSKWLHFATLLPGVDPNLPPKHDEVAAKHWTEAAVEAFAKKLSLKEKFAAAWTLKGGA